MDIPPHEPARVPPQAPAPGRQASPPETIAGKPVRWGRFGLAALLGLVAGTIFFPSPAEGRGNRRRET